MLTPAARRRFPRRGFPKFAPAIFPGGQGRLPARRFTSQPSIKGHSPTQNALDELMLGKGYEKLDEGAYYDEGAGLLVFDRFPRNAIQAADGHIYPIDPVIQRIMPDFGQFLRQEPYTINLR